MCGNIVQIDGSRYAELFGVTGAVKAPAHYSRVPGHDILAVRADGTGGRELLFMRWGMSPAWMGDSGRVLYNARWETLGYKPTFVDSFRHRRCIVPMEGFFEWKVGAGGRRPCLIERRDGQIIAAAGLWMQQDRPVCVVVTGVSQPSIGWVHDRMPLILGVEDYAEWLNPHVESPSVKALVADLTVRNI